ncbi:tyrosine-protein phosphatase [Fibrella forsythiae]|uniref:protein-tyrosine-phosphatase n=1 Tax=Fibrella forsythiae TaxID=2817061 RepID=A0ABS3JQR1_9BACT|nr:CpsB/CapC family capsule biosynthesis tyrosine phosphatase [Fibrella forsythiae]MBO0952328.1 histidinol-phosphatase [Fibrella forsythiae]
MASFWQTLTNRLKPGSSSPQPVRAGYVVDMHSHLLPDVDDGIRTIDEAMTCLRQFAEWGIEHVVTTPHVSQDMFPSSSDLLRTVADDVRTQLLAEQLPITFDLAAEYMVDELFVKRLHQNDLLSFGTERYVLIETGWASLPMQLNTWIFQMQVQGYKPVLAHPERYAYFRGKTEALADLRQQGCLLQLNLMSLTGRYGSDARRMAQQLIQDRLVDFVSSDLHHPRDLPTLEKAIQTTDYQSLCQLPLQKPTFR